MAFVQAMNSPDSDTTKRGINGADVYTEEGVGDYRITLFTMLNRGLEASYIQDSVDVIFKRGVESEMRDLFVMAFQTRDVRGGKGEKKLFYTFIQALYKYDKEVVKKLLPLVPTYGCWRDMWEIMREVPELEADILSVTKGAFIDDLALANSNQISKMSLLAKWLPREGSGKYKGLARKLANYIYSFDSSERKRIVKYRKDVSFMNKELKTVEINMCGGTWRDIKPEAVPGRCLKIHSKAFYNESAKGEIRFADNEDRVACRQHFQEFSEAMKRGEKKAHGTNVVLPHELVEQALQYNATRNVLDINQGQWESIKEETLLLGGLGKCVPLCDFSGSMNGVPKLVSLALGILVSEINHPAFRDHILTFDAEPTWHSFVGKKTLKAKLDSVRVCLGIGLNTDFYRACMKVLDKMKQGRVPVGEEPEDLLVLTDMGFDAASNPHNDTNIVWKTQLEQIRDAFRIAGEELWGAGNGWRSPRIVIWNLRAEYKDFHAKADQDGVVQLSGWSPSILKALQKEGVKVATPYEGLRIILDDERYDPVRRVWNEVHSS